LCVLRVAVARTTGAKYLTALYNASYMDARTNATPAELAAVQAIIDEQSDTLGGSGLPKNDLAQRIKEDLGQFMAFADDLTRMDTHWTNFPINNAKVAAIENP